MINGAHVIVYSKDADADRAFLRDVLDLPNVDVGHGWLIFGLPPSEVAVHPAETGGTQELFFMCESVDTVVVELTTKGIPCTPIEELGWGRLFKCIGPPLLSCPTPSRPERFREPCPKPFTDWQITMSRRRPGPSTLPRS